MLCRQDPTVQVGQELNEAELTSNSWFWGLGPSALSWPCFDFLFGGRVTCGFPDLLWPEAVILPPLTLIPSCLFFLRSEFTGLYQQAQLLIISGFLCVCFGFGFPYLICQVIFKMNLVTCPNNLSLYRRCCTRSRDQSCVLFIYVQTENGMFLWMVTQKICL